MKPAVLLLGGALIVLAATTAVEAQRGGGGVQPVRWNSPRPGVPALNPGRVP